MFRLKHAEELLGRHLYPASRIRRWRIAPAAGHIHLEVAIREQNDFDLLTLGCKHAGQGEGDANRPVPSRRTFNRHRCTGYGHLPCDTDDGLAIGIELPDRGLRIAISRFYTSSSASPSKVRISRFMATVFASFTTQSATPGFSPRASKSCIPQTLQVPW